MFGGGGEVLVSDTIDGEGSDVMKKERYYVLKRGGERKLAE